MQLLFRSSLNSSISLTGGASGVSHEARAAVGRGWGGGSGGSSSQLVRPPDDINLHHGEEALAETPPPPLKAPLWAALWQL